jgi:hypothetical protein
MVRTASIVGRSGSASVGEDPLAAVLHGLGRKIRLRLKTNFSRSFNPIAPLHPSRRKFSLSLYQKLWFTVAHPAS